MPLLRASTASSGSLFGGLTGFGLEGDGGALGDGASGGVANPSEANNKVAAMKDLMKLMSLMELRDDREIRWSNKEFGLGAGLLR